MKRSFYTLTLAAVFILTQQAFCGTYGGGSGTSYSPYIIASAEHLQELEANYADWSKHFLLTEDIDLSSITYTTAIIAPDTNSSKSDFQGVYFSGVFDGNGHVIKNLRIDTGGADVDYLGLFGKISGYYASVRDLGLTNININGGTASYYVGGLVGDLNNGILSNCFAAGSVRGFCFIGGLAGVNSDTIRYCCATGSISGANRIGGLVGNNSDAITKCYATGSISGDSSIGGLTGYNSGTLTNCYTTGYVHGDSNLGGLVGYNSDGSYDSSFWDSEVNPSLKGVGGGYHDPAGVIGRTTLELQTQSTFTDHGWDFVNRWYLPTCGSPVLKWQTVGIVPDVTGLLQADAESLINLAGPAVTIKTVHSKVVPSGHVISQEPLAGCEAAIVTIIVSHGFPYETGNGTDIDPYQIWTAQQMNAIGTHLDDWNKQFVLMNDIDLSVYAESSYNIIGDVINEFSGFFDGNGNTISNLTYSSSGYSDNTGLFGVVGSDGQISGLGLLDVVINAEDGWHVGGLIGENNGSVSNCYVTGSVSAYDSVGCMVGNNDGTITNCYVICSVSGEDSIGGLAGNNGGTITNCHAIGDIDGDYLGGLAGSNSGTIANCYAAGNVTGEGPLGGLVAENSGVISNCFSAGSASGYECIGGLVGISRGGTIKNCYAANFVRGVLNVGGLVGREDYPTDSIYESSFWNSDLNPGLTAVGNIYDPAGVMSKTTLELQMQSTFISEGWDFVGEDINGTEDIWYMPSCGNPALSWQQIGVVPDVTGLSDGNAIQAINSAGLVAAINTVHSKVIPSGYVISQEQAAGCEAAVVTVIVSDGFPYQSGNGTETDPYQIGTAEEMNAVGVCPGDWDKHFVLMNDVDLSDYMRTSINEINEIRVLSGSFDGNGHTVSNFTYLSSDMDYIGLFGCVKVGGQIRNLGLVDVNISKDIYGYGYSTGSLAGENYGNITNCFVTGSVIGSNYVGGLVGYNKGNITNCSASADTSGSYDVGGLVGINYQGNITYCYAACSVGGSRRGGVTGSNWGGSYSECFWDSDIVLAGVGNGEAPVGVMGRTTLEMQTQSTFTDHGWDFVGEEINGTIGVWRLCVDGVGYPELAWEHDRFGDFECPDGTADEDLVYFADHWLSTDERADLNHDGSITFADFAIFAENWMQGI